MQSITNIYTYITGNSEDRMDGLKKLSDFQIIKVANELTGLFSTSESKFKIELPRLVVVGSQSSGKSSVLNGLIRMDILPMGKSMVTRTPLDIRLIQIPDSQGKIEFGSYDKGCWEVKSMFTLTLPEPTKHELNNVSDEIEEITSSIAGQSKNISHKPIFIKIYSPHVPNLSLVDLPGLTTVACTDKGQPKDIGDQIKKLVKSYIQNDRSLILAVMPAPSDVETDIGLGLIKECDPHGKRTIGILTKPDLMNKEMNVANYITNNVSKDLQFDHGYYLVKNRSSDDNITMEEGIEQENKYFQQHPAYSKLDQQNRLGIVNLGSGLSFVLINSIKKLLPDVIKEILNLETNIDRQLLNLGQDIPKDDISKSSLVNALISEFSYVFKSSLEDRGAAITTGTNIRSIYEQFKKEVDLIEPFKLEYYSNDNLMKLIKNCEGNHMPFPIPPIEVLEYCMKDPHRRPIALVKPIAKKCTKQIHNELSNLVDSILKNEKFSRFNKIVIYIKDEVINKIFIECQVTTLNMIDNIIKMEEGCIWTDDLQFRNDLSNISNNVNVDPDLAIEPDNMKKVLIGYYEPIRYHLKHIIHKTIQTFFVNRSIDTIYLTLFDKINRKCMNRNIQLCDLLLENKEISSKRNRLLIIKTKINNAKKITNMYDI
jgi:hypothetical protein